jgi:hypothetical protein
MDGSSKESPTNVLSDINFNFMPAQGKPKSATGNRINITKGKGHAG